MKFLLAISLVFLSIIINAQVIDEVPVFFAGGEQNLNKQIEKSLYFPKYFIERKATIKLEITCLISDAGAVVDAGTKVVGVILPGDKKNDNKDDETEGLNFIRNQIKKLLPTLKSFSNARLKGKDAWAVYTFECELTPEKNEVKKPSGISTEKPFDFVAIEQAPTFGKKTDKALSDSINNYVRPPALLTYHNLRWNGFVCINKDGNAYDFIAYKPLLVLHGSYDTPKTDTPEDAAFKQWSKDIYNYIATTKGWKPGIINDHETAKKAFISICVGSNCD